VPLKVVEYYRQVAAAAKLKLLRLSLRPYANALCALSAGAAADGETVAFIHLTAEESEIDVLTGGALAFSRSAVIRPSHPEPATADAAAAGPAPAAESAVDAAVNEASRSLRSYGSVHRDRRLERVLVAGGTGHEQAVADALAKRLGVRGEVFDPASRGGAMMPALNAR
jgi:Tfp pilus assembly PilM family ATPase